MNGYRLGDIRPNPFRNIDRYPINREKVDALKASIGRTDFWDNIVARLNDEQRPEIAYGHHRLVALRELFPPDHVVTLIVRELDDAAMLHIMADENMQEWAASSPVIVETVRATREFLNTSRARAKYSRAGQPPKPNGIEEITHFLGWPEARVKDALAILNAEEAGVLTPEDTADLPLRQATVMRQHISRIAEPEVRARAISRVRSDLREGRVGYRGIGEVVREVREQSAPPPQKPVIARAVAEQLYREIDDFFRKTVTVGYTTPSRYELIKLIAANRDAQELQGVAGPLADQIARALDGMAVEASSLARTLRAQELQAVLS